MIGGALIRCEMLNLARASRTYMMRFAFVAVLATVAAFAWPWDEPVHRFASHGFGVFMCFFWVEMIAASFLIPTIVSPAISLERERGTLDLLSVAPISEFEIVFGKLVANVALVSSILLAGIPVAFASLLLGGASAGHIALACCHVLSCGVFAASLSILMSASCEKSGIASSLSLIIMLTLIVGTSIGGGMSVLFLSSASKSAAWYVYSAICPWACYTSDVVDPGSISWGMRFTAWGSQLALSSLSLLMATLIMKGTRSPKGRKIKTPVVPPMQPMPVFAYPPDPRPWSQTAPAPASPVPHSPVPEPLISMAEPREKLIASVPDDTIPMATLMPAPAPLAALPMPPQESWWKYRRSMKSRLPVGSNPIFWKEISFRRNVGQQVLVILASIACALILLLSLFSFSGGGGEIHYTLLFEFSILLLLATGAGASTLGPEREQGTLPILLNTGISPFAVLQGKMLGAVYAFWPVLAFFAAHLVVMLFSHGPDTLFVVLAAVPSLVLVIAASCAASLHTGKPRRATSLALFCLGALWFLPPILTMASDDIAEYLVTLNPWVQIAFAIDFSISDPGSRSEFDPLNLLLYILITAFVSTLLFVWTARSMESRVRR